MMGWRQGIAYTTAHLRVPSNSGPKVIQKWWSLIGIKQLWKGVIHFQVNPFVDVVGSHIQYLYWTLKVPQRKHKTSTFLWVNEVHEIIILFAYYAYWRFLICFEFLQHVCSKMGMWCLKMGAPLFFAVSLWFIAIQHIQPPQKNIL